MRRLSHMLGLAAKLPEGALEMYERGEVFYKIARHRVCILAELERERDTASWEATRSAEDRCPELQEYEAAVEATGLKFQEHLSECQRCQEWFLGQF